MSLGDVGYCSFSVPAIVADESKSTSDLIFEGLLHAQESAALTRDALAECLQSAFECMRRAHALAAHAHVAHIASLVLDMAVLDETSVS